MVAHSVATESNSGSFRDEPNFGKTTFAAYPRVALFDSNRAGPR
jgi:hypothetical protein